MIKIKKTRKEMKKRRGIEKEGKGVQREEREMKGERGSKSSSSKDRVSQFRIALQKHSNKKGNYK